MIDLHAVRRMTQSHSKYVSHPMYVISDLLSAITPAPSPAPPSPPSYDGTPAELQSYSPILYFTRDVSPNIPSSHSNDVVVADEASTFPCSEYGITDSITMAMITTSLRDPSGDDISVGGSAGSSSEDIPLAVQSAKSRKDYSFSTVIIQSPRKKPIKVSEPKDVPGMSLPSAGFIDEMPGMIIKLGRECEGGTADVHVGYLLQKLKI